MLLGERSVNEPKDGPHTFTSLQRLCRTLLRQGGLWESCQEGPSPLPFKVKVVRLSEKGKFSHAEAQQGAGEHSSVIQSDPEPAEGHRGGGGGGGGGVGQGEEGQVKKQDVEELEVA